MIHIDFQAGAHGNYLEFVCNKIAGVAVGTPFNSAGASHDKVYVGGKIFHADHYSFRPKPFEFDKIISIHIEVDDLLPLQQISLLRAGDYGNDNDQLEINTYNKLNNQDYCWVLDNITQSFFTNQIRDSYNAVKDPSWPEVTTLTEFENLPNWIKQECIEQHKLELLEISPTYPNCPRPILREFFQIGFQQPEIHGFLDKQQAVEYNKLKQVYVFPFAYCQHDIDQLHDEFLIRQTYKHSKIKCDNIVTQIQNNKTNLSQVDLLEEAYINAKLGWNYFT